MLLNLGIVQLRLLPIGAYIRPDPRQYLALAPADRFLVAAAGPLASLLYGLALILASGPSLGLKSLGELSIYLALVNLLPIPPLDGWLMLESYREHRGQPLSDFGRKLVNALGHGVIYCVGSLFFLQALAALLN